MNVGGRAPVKSWRIQFKALLLAWEARGHLSGKLTYQDLTAWSVDNFRLADHRLAISIGTDAPVLACEVVD